jgi:succinate-semialdehyde dehydrogenase/glutarate-semialdehyde dehydrogenase
VILKHASNVPASASKFEEAVLRAGFPDGLFQNLFLTHRQTEDVIASRTVRSVSLTGSNIAGEKIAAMAGTVTKSCVLELGGSDPFIVFEDADTGRAAEAAITGRFQNSGQSCIATKRIFLHDSIYDKFMDSFKGHVSKLKVGDPMDPDTDIGPLVNIEAVNEIKRQVNESLKRGAKITAGKIESQHGEAFIEPLVVENVPDNCPLATEEVFGPVIPVFRFSNYDDMISRVNSSIFGLGSSVWTKNKDLIEKVTMDIDAGMVAVNGFTRSDPALPFGGVKSSGYGRELSDNGMMEFLNIKTISVFD